MSNTIKLRWCVCDNEGTDFQPVYNSDPFSHPTSLFWLWLKLPLLDLLFHGLPLISSLCGPRLGKAFSLSRFEGFLAFWYFSAMSAQELVGTPRDVTWGAAGHIRTGPCHWDVAFKAAGMPSWVFPYGDFTRTLWKGKKKPLMATNCLEEGQTGISREGFPKCLNSLTRNWGSPCFTAKVI